MKKKIKEYIPSKFLYIILFLIPVLYIFSFTSHLDNDIWYLLSEGRYIVNHGIYYIDPLSIHEGLEVTVQNWASASLFYLSYKAFGEIGIFSIIVLCDLAISYLLYKICTLISDNNRLLSLVCMFATNMLLVVNYMVARPQIFSFVLLLGVIYVLELYVKTENKKYLRWLPILSIIEANMHGSLWFMIFLFALCYIIDGLRVDFLKTQGYKLKPLLIYLLIAFACGVINPYGYKMITFIFTSFGDHYMHIFIRELLPLSFANIFGKEVFVVSLFVGLSYAFFRECNTRVRYLCLFAGTLILGVSTVKACSHFFLVAIFPLAYFFKDLFPRSFDEIMDVIKPFRYFMMVMAIFLGVCLCYNAISIPDRVKLKSDIEKCADVIKETYGSDAIVFTPFNSGGTVEFYGLKPYIDPRAEVFLKINNKKDDIFHEFYDLSQGNRDFSLLQEKYNFTHAIVDKDIEYYDDIIAAGFTVLYKNEEKENDKDYDGDNFRVLVHKSVLEEMKTD